MRTLLHLLRTDVRRLLKTPSVPLLWLAFPLALSAIEYGAFGRIGRSSTGLPKGVLLVVDDDRSVASGIFVSSLQREPLDDFFTVAMIDSAPVAMQRLLDNEGSAILGVPRGFQDSILARRRVLLDYTPNAREIIRPQMIDASLRTFLEIGNRFLSQADSALAALDVLRGKPDAPDRASVMAIAGSFYDVGKNFDKLQSLGDLDVAIRRPPVKPGTKLRSGDAPNFFSYFLPGLLLFSVLMVGQGYERRAFRIREMGLERRIAASPIRRLTVFLADAVTVLVVILATGVVILLLDAVLFHIPLRQPATIGIVLLGFGLFTIGLMKVIYGRARSKRAAEIVGSIVTLLTTLVGGGFVPVELYTSGVRPFATATPVGCASQAMVDALVHGKAFSETTQHVLLVWMWALGMCVIGFTLAWRPREHA